MPDFVSTALEESGLRRKYDNRPPYQRNDYLRWINGAKKAETDPLPVEHYARHFPKDDRMKFCLLLFSQQLYRT